MTVKENGKIHERKTKRKKCRIEEKLRKQREMRDLSQNARKKWKENLNKFSEQSTTLWPDLCLCSPLRSLMVFPLSPPIRRSIWCLLNIVENITLYFCHHLWEKTTERERGRKNRRLKGHKVSRKILDCFLWKKE